VSIAIFHLKNREKTKVLVPVDHFLLWMHTICREKIVF
jgi:hypothetical protein